MIPGIIKLQLVPNEKLFTSKCLYVRSNAKVHLRLRRKQADLDSAERSLTLAVASYWNSCFIWCR